MRRRVRAGQGLLDPSYITSRSAADLARPHDGERRRRDATGRPARVLAPNANVPGTSDLVAADRYGNVAEVTTTIESYFGSGVSVDGNDAQQPADRFRLRARSRRLSHRQPRAGRQAPRSSMSPTIVYNRSGTVRIALGAAGGSTIIAQVAKTLVAVLDWKMSAQDAIGLGLLYAPGRVATAEKGTLLEPMVPALQALGESVQLAPLGLKANAIERVGGRWVGAADPRSEGVAMGEDGSVTTIVRVNAMPNRPPE